LHAHHDAASRPSTEERGSHRAYVANSPPPKFSRARDESPAELEKGLLALCEGRYLTGAELAALTGRSAETLRSHYLNRLVASGKLSVRFPENPTHPGQSYTKA